MAFVTPKSVRLSNGVIHVRVSEDALPEFGLDNMGSSEFDSNLPTLSSKLPDTDTLPDGVSLVITLGQGSMTVTRIDEIGKRHHFDSKTLHQKKSHSVDALRSSKFKALIQANKISN